MVIFNKLFIRPTNNSIVQFLRYGFVASIALAVDFGSLVFIKEYCHLNYIIAASISFTAGLLVNYILSKLWVFEKSKLVNQKKEFIIFATIGLIGLGMTDLILWFLTSIVGLYYILSKAIATILVYFWNFGARKKILFN